MSTMSGDIPKSTTKCGEIGGGGDDDEKKMSTSYEQKSKISGGEGSSSDIDTGSKSSKWFTSFNEPSYKQNHKQHVMGGSTSSIDLQLKTLRELQHLRQLDLSLAANNASTANDDDTLFTDPPSKEDCPICMQPMPYSGICGVRTTYEPCCGKKLCEACVMAFAIEMVGGDLKDLCAFCRVPMARNDKEDMKRIKKRMKLNDPEAFFTLGWWYYRGQTGLPNDSNKAIEIWKQAAELESVGAQHSMGVAYNEGQGVERDIMAIHHWKLAAIGGHEVARLSLGIEEMNEGHFRRAMKHWMISSSAGYDEALKQVGQGYKDGFVSKDEYASTLRAYKTSIDEMKSRQRDIFGGQVKQIP